MPSDLPVSTVEPGQYQGSPPTVAATDNPLLLGQDHSLTAALEALRPAIEPAPIPFWPLAPGWWITISTLLLLVTLVSFYCYRRHQFLKATRYQREADALLAHVMDKPGTLAQLQEIARILRRSAISAYGRESAGTQPWMELAQRVTVTGSGNSTSAGGQAVPVFDEKSLGLLCHTLYQQEHPAPAEIEHLLQQARIWLVKLPPRKGNAT